MAEIMIHGLQLDMSVLLTNSSVLKVLLNKSLECFTN